MMRRLTTLVLVAACAAGASAQADGDIVFATTSGVFYLPADLSTAETVWPGPGVGSFGWQSLKTATGNQGVVGGNTTGTVVRLAHGGNMATLGQLTSGWATAIDLDTDYRYICSATTSGIVTMGVSGGSSVFNTAGNASINGLCRNLRNGDWAFVTSSPSPQYLGVVSYNGQTLTRLTTIQSGATGVCYMPAADQYAVTYLSTAAPVRIYSSSGLLRRSIYLPTNVRGNCCAYDQRTGSLYVGTVEGVLYELTSAGNFVRRRSTTRGSINGIDIYGDQRISVRVFGTNPVDMNVILFFRGMSGQPYCLALSLGMAPGISLPGGRINLQPDPLFFLTACGQLPFFTTGFTGTIRPTGSANGFFTIPVHVPFGTPVHVSGVVIDPASPGGIAIGNTETIIQH